MAKFTVKQRKDVEVNDVAIKKYIKSNGMNCLACGVDNLKYGVPVQQDDSQITMNVTCNSCGAYWVEVYTLHNVMPADAE